MAILVLKVRVAYLVNAINRGGKKFYIFWKLYINHNKMNEAFRNSFKKQRNGRTHEYPAPSTPAPACSFWIWARF